MAMLVYRSVIGISPSKQPLTNEPLIIHLLALNDERKHQKMQIILNNISRYLGYPKQGVSFFHD